MENIDLKPPKIIVGVSITLPEEDWFDAGVSIFPAILDTGLNAALMIHHYHLKEWALVSADNLYEIDLAKPLNGGRHKYDEFSGNIWLHRLPYSGRYIESSLASDRPIRLNQTNQIRVVTKGESFFPRLPLIGLEALLANGLNLSVNSKTDHFTISK